jgi:hypothetical protein
MPITINGSGTVTGITAGGLPDGVITGDDIAANAVTLGKLGTTEQSQLCKAWVNFNGSGTVAIRASFNVSSITDNGVGDYTVNLTTALADANYACISTGSQQAGVTDLAWSRALPVTASTASVYSFARTGTTNVSYTTYDPSTVQVAFFR